MAQSVVLKEIAHFEDQRTAAYESVPDNVERDIAGSTITLTFTQAQVIEVDVQCLANGQDANPWGIALSLKANAEYVSTVGLQMSGADFGVNGGTANVSSIRKRHTFAPGTYVFKLVLQGALASQAVTVLDMAYSLDIVVPDRDVKL